MLLHLPNILTADEVQQAQALLADARWSDGRTGAGDQARQVKNNEQLDHDCAAAQAIRALVLRALDRSPLFFSAALPKRVFPPRLNRYGGDSNYYGNHIDGAVRYLPDSGQRVRTDVSCTVFLADPASYDGGELVIRDTFGEHAVKLPAGHLLIYPGSSLHKINPVTRGERIASFFWIESLVREDSQRQLLLDMDVAIQTLTAQDADHHALLQLSGAYHNLLRRWSDG